MAHRRSLRAQAEGVVLAHRDGSGSKSGSRTAAPVALRRVTSGVTAVIFSAGLRRPSDTSATITGVIAVATSVPRSQTIGTTTAAATAAAAEIASV